MAYEVTKTVNGRAYRYRVRSERDPDTGKTRNRWTYLGRAGAAGPTAVRERANAREALLDALERLLDRDDLSEVTAGAVSVEAGLAHGTFYRYFKNKNAAIYALLDRVRAAKSASGDVLMRETPATRAAARDALRAWAERLLRTPGEHPGAIRALYDLAARDPVIGAARRERREAYARVLAERLEAFAARGFAHIGDPANAASAIFAMLDGFYREAIGTDGAIDEGRIVAALDLIERGVFGAL